MRDQAGWPLGNLVGLGVKAEHGRAGKRADQEIVKAEQNDGGQRADCERGPIAQHPAR